ncbi:hypothetical protein [Paraburkholderia fynbosensis]|uniref:Uncharacterized protein n=1 Tax=Paraburkholderia fynbosensis TaxID=1200993 RepID=A0A6J5G9Z1_9BURK|nr:hypothetical protein [Paraburkholderia fynbosensis]CAB3794534.1 hypothetical protein LMG27177_03651 [Paraburkholderia fynbosensis]
MLTAVLQGKRRGSGLEGVGHDLSFATGSEDLLTSLVFERVSYLSDDAVSAFWTALLPETVRPVGRIERVEFWPRFELEGSLIEPDLLLVTEAALVVVEAKRWDQMDQQYATQVAREIQAVLKAEPLAGELRLIMLLVGGRQDTSPASTSAFESLVHEQLVGEQLSDEIEVHAVKWLDTLEAFGAIALTHPGYQRMRDDVEAGLRFHGLIRERELRLHELCKAGLSVETFKVLVEARPDVESAIVTGQRPVARATPLHCLTRQYINSECFLFYK